MELTAKADECKAHNMMNNSNVMGMYDSCGCVGYGYVPVQEMGDVYGTDNAIMRGTVFPELDLSICEYGCVCKQWGGASDDE